MSGSSEEADPRSRTLARRSAVLDAALGTFARFGYRKTSMDDVAADARISRPGLYFLFASKGALFREAADRAIELDLAAAERALTMQGPALDERIVAAFDCWAGRYVGPLGDVHALVADNPDLLGPVAQAGPARFELLLRDAFDAAERRDADAVVRTLVSVSVGLKHQVGTRDEHRARMREAVRLIV